MSKLWSSSIGKKLVMSLSGLFLLVFLLVHLVANLFFYGGEDAYNAMCEFMDTNPAIQVMVPVLAAGFVIHIAWATAITLKNRIARPVNRGTCTSSGSSSSAYSHGTSPTFGATCSSSTSSAAKP